MKNTSIRSAAGAVVILFGLVAGGQCHGQFIQSSQQTITSTSASVTSLDGFPASIQSQTIRPFVTGIIPVVSGYAYGQPARNNASQQMFQSGQLAQQEYLQSRRQANMNVKQQRAYESLQRAMRAEQSGNLRQARANYRSALASDQGPLRQQILFQMRRRGWQ